MKCEHIWKKYSSSGWYCILCQQYREDIPHVGSKVLTMSRTKYLEIKEKWADGK